LSAEEEKEIREEVEAADVTGERYPEAFMKACYADTPPLKEGGVGSGGSSGQTTDILGGLYTSNSLCLNEVFEKIDCRCD
jgi:hypothetical protein